MKAIIRLPNGKTAKAWYVWEDHIWALDSGLGNVPVPPGESAMGALRKVHPTAVPVSTFD